MSDDVKALIAQARKTPLRPYEDNAVGLVRRLADALEASVQAPESADAECGDYPAPCNCDNPDTHDRAEGVQAPAVDREALRGALTNVLSNAMNYPEAVQARMLGQHTGGLIEKVATAVEGVLLDAAEVEARGLEKASNSGEFNSTVCIALNKRARRVREGNE